MAESRIATSGFGTTMRRDAWWVELIPVVLVLGAFSVYATWRTFENNFYEFGPYLSPFYSPLIKPKWWPLSPAILILWAPLGFRAGLPSWVGLVLSLIKDSSLAGVIGYVEFTRSAQMLMTRTHETWLMLIGTGLFYFLICYPVSKYSRQLERKVLV